MADFKNIPGGVEQRDVDLFIMNKGQYFPEFQLKQLRDELMALSHERFMLVTSIEYRDPTLLLLLSIFLGYLGVDRFLLGDVGQGVGKLLTTLFCGIGFIWWFIDLFQISQATRNYNYLKLRQAINLYA